MKGPSNIEGTVCNGSEIFRYTTIIKGFAKTKDLNRAMKLYRDMLAENVPCNVVTYNSLIDVAVRCTNMKVAAMVLQEMQGSGTCMLFLSSCEIV